MTASVLKNEACISCRNTGAQPLSQTESQELLSQVEGWELAQDGKCILRRLKFKNFREALAFVNKLGEVAEAEKHHPDITFGWGYAEIVYTTHDVGGLHRNDFILAAKTNALLEA
ncbi:MAG: 4a-hydroxytetrahydrobiopterin dehydratase [Alphaproteobacteria bacterium]|nr:4a-hydroxytetrahydrobiopterin dehydratase [Alphaproteobacteria bacterium]